jgi:uncharacterized protein
MFVDFFFHLRARGIMASPMEFLGLLEALDRGLVGESLDKFYAVARAMLVKRVEQYDLYDQIFAEYFKDLPFTGAQAADIGDAFWDWLENPKTLRELTEEEKARLERLDLEKLREMFEERLKEQKERHDGGNKWIGTGGTSPFGHSGHHPGGIRVGGESGSRSAVQVASKRRFKNLRDDLILDTRQMGVALRKLRRLKRTGQARELDLDATIDKTAKNAGDIELVFDAPRKNDLKLLLLMDVGGSMNPHSRLTSQLFSAAHKARHFKSFQSYYFHNCPYEHLFTDIALGKSIPTLEALAQLDATWRCIIVGDAAMAPSELMEPGGSVDYFHYNEQPGLYWLQKIRETVPKTAWLNPDNPRWWGGYTTRVIGQLFDMFPLTLEGLEHAVDRLR